MKSSRIWLFAGSLGGLTGICLATVLNNGLGRLGQNLLLTAIASTPTAIATAAITSGKAQRRITEAEREASESSRRVDKSTRALALIQHDLDGWKSAYEAIQASLKALQIEKTNQGGELASAREALAQAKKLNADLRNQHEATLAKLSTLDDEIAAWEMSYQNKLDADIAKLSADYQKKESQRIWDELFPMLQDGIAVAAEFESIIDDIAHRNQVKSEIALGLTHQFNANIDDFAKAHTEQVDTYLRQIDNLHNQVALLQQELAKELAEPQYGDFGFAPEGKIANAIARDVFAELSIPLAVTGFHPRPDGSVDVGYGYSRSANPEELVQVLRAKSGDLASRLRIHKIVNIRKLEITDCLALTYRLSPAIKDSDVKLLSGSAEEFLAYISSHPIRYRLIADPGHGKTPTTAVMLSEILKVGGTRGNTAKGKRIPHTLISVSCPDVSSSQKDRDYPLEPFLKYGDTTSAIKSLDEALADWEYRKRNTNYADNFFQIWVWDELDNTLNSSSDPQEAGTNLKKILKQAHHTGVGWIVSGQSVMTKQIPGFFDDDRELFTEIIIGSSKIRKYLDKYGKKTLSEGLVRKLLTNLEQLDGYLEDKNSMITDDARLLRLALVLDNRSPKLYFLPNFDSAIFDLNAVEETRRLADQNKRSISVISGQNAGEEMAIKSRNSCSEGVGKMVTDPPFLPIGVVSQFDQKPHCPHCTSTALKITSDKRYQCPGCKKRFVQAKAVWR